MSISPFAQVQDLEVIELFQDNYRQIDVYVINADTEVAFDLTGYLGWFMLKARLRDKDSLALISKRTDDAAEGSIVSEAGGQMRFIIGRSDTSSLKPGTYFWDAGIQEVSGAVKKYTVASGQLVLKEAVLKGSVPA